MALGAVCQATGEKMTGPGLDEQGARALVAEALNEALDAAGVDKKAHRDKIRALAAEQLVVRRIGDQDVIVAPSVRDGFARYRPDAQRMQPIDLVREIVANDPLLAAVYAVAQQSNFDAHPEAIVLTREQARNTRTYQRATEQAKREGREVLIAEADPKPPKLVGRSGTIRDGKLLISRAVARDAVQYGAYRERAEREGLDLQIVD